MKIKSAWQRCTVISLAIMMVFFAMPAAAFAAEGIDDFQIVDEEEVGYPDPEYDEASGEQASSWRFENGFPESTIAELREAQGVAPFAAFDDLKSDYRATWSRSNGINTYTYREHPTDKDQLIRVNGTLAVGIDVSEHNNNPGGGAARAIDWNKVKADGVTFAIIRCGYGSDYASQDDEWFSSNYKGAKAAGLKVGIYLYSYATKVSGLPSASSEAAHVMRVLRANNIRPSDLDLPIYYDLEDDSQRNLSARTIGQLAETFCGTLQAQGYGVGIYANKDWFENVLTDSVFSLENMRSRGWSRWVARYPYQQTTSGISGTDIWQFSSIGRVNGTPSKYCDVNYIYTNALGSKDQGTWVKEGSSWYLRSQSGENLCGWRTVGGKRFYLDPSTGAMMVGWQKIGGLWYYFTPGDSGAMKYGWQKIGGRWYYLDLSTGVMKTGWQKVSGGWFYLTPGDSGAMKTGWQKISGGWYYLTPGDSGRMKTGWQKIDGKWFYLTPGDSGRMMVGWQKINGSWYYLTPGDSGAMKTGWQTIGGKRYYFRPGDSGIMVTGKVTINGNRYTFDSSGALIG